MAFDVAKPIGAVMPRSKARTYGRMGLLRAASASRRACQQDATAQGRYLPTRLSSLMRAASFEDEIDKITSLLMPHGARPLHRGRPADSISPRMPTPFSSAWMSKSRLSSIDARTCSGAHYRATIDRHAAALSMEQKYNARGDATCRHR